MQRNENSIMSLYDDILQLIKCNSSDLAQALIEQLDNRLLTKLSDHLHTNGSGFEQVVNLLFKNKQDDIKKRVCIYFRILLLVEVHIETLEQSTSIQRECLSLFQIISWRDSLIEAIQALPNTDLLFNLQIVVDNEMSFLALFKKLPSRTQESALNHLMPYLFDILENGDEFISLLKALPVEQRLPLLLKLAEDLGSEVFSGKFGSLRDYLAWSCEDRKIALIMKELSEADLDDRYDVFEDFIYENKDDYFIFKTQLQFYANQYKKGGEAFQQQQGEYYSICMKSIEFFLELLQGNIPDQLTLIELAEHKENILSCRYLKHIEQPFLKEMVRLLASDLRANGLVQGAGFNYQARFFAAPEPWLLRQKLGSLSYGEYDGFFTAFNFARKPAYTEIQVPIMRSLIARELKSAPVNENEITPLQHIEVLSNILRIPIVVLHKKNEYPRFMIIEKMGMDFLAIKPPVFLCLGHNGYAALEINPDHSVSEVLDELETNAHALSCRM